MKAPQLRPLFGIPLCALGVYVTHAALRRLRWI
jgi:hypothetical protein